MGGSRPRVSVGKVRAAWWGQEERENWLPGGSVSERQENAPSTEAFRKWPH